MSESQHIEHKQKWHDDHLKWVCGFANAAGGVLQVGVPVPQVSPRVVLPDGVLL